MTSTNCVSVRLAFEKIIRFPSLLADAYRYMLNAHLGLFAMNSTITVSASINAYHA
jgi:hypothetical protein